MTPPEYPDVDKMLVRALEQAERDPNWHNPNARVGILITILSQSLRPLLAQDPIRDLIVKPFVAMTQSIGGGFFNPNDLVIVDLPPPVVEPQPKPAVSSAVTPERTVAALLKHPNLAYAVALALGEKVVGPWELHLGGTIRRRVDKTAIGFVAEPDAFGQVFATIYPGSTPMIGESTRESREAGWEVEITLTCGSVETGKQWVDRELVGDGYLLG